MDARGNTRHGRGRGRGHFNQKTYLPGGNYRSTSPTHPITEGLSNRAIGGLDNRTLRFVESTARAAELDLDLAVPAADVAISNMRCVGSFNWVNAETPTILVPGNTPQPLFFHIILTWN